MLAVSLENSCSDRVASSSSEAVGPSLYRGVVPLLADPGAGAWVGTKLTPGLDGDGGWVGRGLFQALAMVEVGTEAGVGLPAFGGRAGKASGVFGVAAVGFGGIAGGFWADAAVVETVGRAGKASLAVEIFGVVPVGAAGTIGNPCLVVVGVTAATVGFTVEVTPAVFAVVVVGTVTPALTVVFAVVGATVVVLSFLPPNNPPNNPPPDFLVVGTGVVVVGFGVVVVVVLGSFSLPLPPNSPPKKPFFLVVVGAGVVVDVVTGCGGGTESGSTGAYESNATLGFSGSFFLPLPNHWASESE